MIVEEYIDSLKHNHDELLKFFDNFVYWSTIKIGDRVLERQVHPPIGEGKASNLRVAVYTLESWLKAQEYLFNRGVELKVPTNWDEMTDSVVVNGNRFDRWEDLNLSFVPSTGKAPLS